MYILLNAPVQEIFVGIAYAQKPPLNTHADISSWARSPYFGMNLFLLLYFVYTKSEASTVTVFMHMLTGAFAACRCYFKYQNILFCPITLVILRPLRVARNKKFSLNQQVVMIAVKTCI